MDNSYKKLTRNTTLFAIGTVGSKAVSFFMVPLYTYVLSTEEYGIADLIMMITTLLYPLFTMHIGEAVLYYGLSSSQQNEKGKILKNSLGIVSVGCAFLICLSPLSGFYVSLADYNYYLITYMIVYMFRMIMTIYTKSCEKNNVYAIDSILYAVVVASLNILFLLYLHLGVKGYLLAYIIGEAISFAWLFIYHGVFGIVVREKIDKYLIKKMIGYSAPLIINSISWSISSSTDRIMINSLLATSFVGIYAVAQKIPSLIQTSSQIFLRAWTISAYLEKNDNGREFYVKVFSMFSFIITLIVSLVLLISRPFVYMFIGPGFRNACLYMPLLLISVLFQIYAAFFGSIIQSGNKNYLMTISTVTAAVINIFLNYYLIIYWGVQGAVIATALSYLVVFLMRMRFSRRINDFRINYMILFSTIVILIIQAVTVIVDYHFVAISIAALIVILFMNREYIHVLIKWIRRIVK